uniref:Uncharacterized protein n=1 Tax=Phlegmariurus squarrosus TaxID=73615 RepID=H9M890_PHLSQ|nr:hypothetical protein HusqMp118 [Phlegmariurus squarrosus]AEV55797.1 hypothetical protein HusqMp118 [Phlegmariurus squarrosus]
MVYYPTPNLPRYFNRAGNKKYLVKKKTIGWGVAAYYLTGKHFLGSFLSNCSRALFIFMVKHAWLRLKLSHPVDTVLLFIKMWCAAKGNIVVTRGAKPRFKFFLSYLFGLELLNSPFQSWMSSFTCDCVLLSSAARKCLCLRLRRKFGNGGGFIRVVVVRDAAGGREPACGGALTL